MNGNASFPWPVLIRDIPPSHTVSIEYKISPENPDTGIEIRAIFQRVQDWLKARGCDPLKMLTIGVIHSINGSLSSYSCCVQAPDNFLQGSEGIKVQDLAGGKFAVLTIPKEPMIIGEAIARFYQEYIPSGNLEIDSARPTYEIYFTSTMEYCVPIS